MFYNLVRYFYALHFNVSYPPILSVNVIYHILYLYVLHFYCPCQWLRTSVNVTKWLRNYVQRSVLGKAELGSNCIHA